MKRNTQKFVSLLASIGMCSSFAFTVSAASDYASMSIGNTESIYDKGEKGDVEIVLYDENGAEQAFEGDYENVTLTSDNENAVTIDENGQMIMKDYGFAKITAEYQGLTASTMVFVNPGELDIHPESNDGAVYRPNASGDKKVILRTGADGADTSNLYMNLDGSINNVDNTIWTGYFYDNGSRTDAEAGFWIGTVSVTSRAYMGTFGIISSSDETYKIADTVRKGSDATSKVNTESTTDTGIARSKGWHQITMVQKTLNGNKGDSNGAHRYVIQNCTVYLDGISVKSANMQWNEKCMNIRGYAGSDTSHAAYFDDIYIMNYIDLQGVSLTADGDAYVANTAYYGAAASDEATGEYIWEAAESKEGPFTAIDGAAEKTYTPDLSALAGKKYIRAGMKVNDTVRIQNGTKAITTEMRYSEPMFIFDGTYESISMNGSDLTFDSKSASAAKKIELLGYDAENVERAITDFSGAEFTSSNPEVAEVSGDGTVTPKDYGTAVISVKYQGLTASTMVLVTPKKHAEKADEYTLAGKINSKNYAETTRPDGMAFYNMSSKQGLPFENVVFTGYFYDNGKREDSEAAVGFMNYFDGTQTGENMDLGAFGVINAADDTYKIANVTSSTTISPTAAENAKDTQIARTAGWHQVRFVQTHAVGNVNNRQADTVAVYLDGVLVKTRGARNGQATSMIGMYSGFDAAHQARFKNASIAYYTSFDGVELSVDDTDGATLVANSTYYGQKDSGMSESYAWYSATEENGEYTKIDGANSQKYTPTLSDGGKYIKAGVRITDTIDSEGDVETREVFSKANYLFDGVYNSLSLGKSKTSFVKGETETSQLILSGFGSDGLERVITDMSNITFASSNDNVVSADENGVLTIKDYGTATITASCNGIEASVLVAVTAKKHVENTEEYKKAGEAISNGAGTAGATGFYNVGANYPFENAVFSGYFYDNGKNEDAEAAIGFARYFSAASGYNIGIGMVGIINSADTTYAIKDISDNCNVFDNGRKTDTQIERTPGWHKVTLVQTSTKGNQANGYADKYVLYLDGKVIKEGAPSSKQATTMIRTYSGADTSHYGQFKDIEVLYYTALENAKLTSESNVFTADFDYFGAAAKADAAVEYKWYMSDTEDGVYTEIPNAGESTYTADSASMGKYIKAGIKVTDTIDGVTVTTNESFTNSILTEGKTSIDYANGKLYITAGADIENAVAITAIYEKAGDYERLVDVKIYNGTITVKNGESKVVAIGATGKTGTQTAKIMLWDGLKTQKSLCDAYVEQ